MSFIFNGIAKTAYFLGGVAVIFVMFDHQDIANPNDLENSLNPMMDDPTDLAN